MDFPIILILLLCLIHQLTVETASSTPKLKSSSFIQRKIETFMIKARELTEILSKPAVTTSKNQTCIDPDISYLAKKKTHMIHLFYDGYGIFNYPAVTKLLDKLNVNSSVNPAIEQSTLEYGSKVCDENTLVLVYDHEKGLCPWHYKAEYRTDRYPRMRMNAECNCKSSCFYMDANKTDITRSCQRVYKHFPVLVRNGCASNGTNQWAMRFERVSVACMCMQQ